MLKKLTNRGFTLVELMVVIAIIGILSAVAVPNFKKYKEKAKMTEVRTNLSSIYTGLVNFEMDSDHYKAGSFANIGMDAASTKNRFTYGFGTTNGTDCDAGIASKACNVPLFQNAAYLTDANASANTQAPITTTYSFVAGASGKIMNQDCGVSLNHEKKMVYTPSGTAPSGGTAGDNNGICQ